jgi:hypothetical protein
MTVISRQQAAHPSTLSLEVFGQAMSQLDLSTTPPHKRADAIRDHLVRVMADTVRDRTLAVELHAARYLRAKRRA